MKEINNAVTDGNGNWTSHTMVYSYHRWTIHTIYLYYLQRVNSGQKPPKIQLQFEPICCGARWSTVINRKAELHRLGCCRILQ